MLAGFESSEAVLGERVGSGGLCGGGRELGRWLLVLEAAAFLAIGLALLKGLELIAPSDKDGVDFAFGACDGIGSTLEDHVLGVTANPVHWEVHLDAMACLEFIAATDKGIAGVDRDGLSNFDSHVEK